MSHFTQQTKSNRWFNNSAMRAGRQVTSARATTLDQISSTAEKSSSREVDGRATAEQERHRNLQVKSLDRAVPSSKHQHRANRPPLTSPDKAPRAGWTITSNGITLALSLPLAPSLSPSLLRRLDLISAVRGDLPASMRALCLFCRSLPRIRKCDATVRRDLAVRSGAPGEGEWMGADGVNKHHSRLRRQKTRMDEISTRGRDLLNPARAGESPTGASLMIARRQSAFSSQSGDVETSWDQTD